MTDKSIRDAISEVYKKVISEAVAVAPVPPVGARPRPAAPAPRPAPTAAPAAPVKYKGSIADFQRENPGATVGQAMNAIQGKRAITGGANDPSVIAQKRAQDAEKGPVQPTFVPNQSTTMRRGEVPGRVADRNTEPGFSGNAGANLMKDVDAVRRQQTPAPTGPRVQDPSKGETVDAARGDIAKPQPGPDARPEQKAEADRIARNDQQRLDNNASVAAQAAAADKAGVPSARPAMTIRNAITSIRGPEEQESGPAKKKKMTESTLINSFLKLQSSGASNMFEAAKKLKGDQHKLDKNQNGKLDSQDFKMLRGEKMEEAKKADKDYDGDGKIESSKDEVWGSRFKAAKKAGKMDEASSSDPDFAAPRPDGTKKPTDIEFKPKPEEKKPEDKVPLPPKRPENMKEDVKVKSFDPISGSTGSYSHGDWMADQNARAERAKKGAEMEKLGQDMHIDKLQRTKDYADKVRKYDPAHADRVEKSMIAPPPNPGTKSKAFDNTKEAEPNSSVRSKYVPGKGQITIAGGTGVDSFDLAGAEHSPEAKKSRDQGGKSVDFKSKDYTPPAADVAPKSDDSTSSSIGKSIGNFVSSIKKGWSGEEKESGPKKKGTWKEEVSFSETELAHFEAVIARKDQKGKERGIGDTVDSADLTDEYMYEMAQRGVKAGTKRGSYKKKATDLSGKRVAGADAGTDESDKGIPHVLDQIRDNKENEHGFKTITNPNSKPEAPVTKQIHRSELHSFYDDYHNTEKPADKEKKYSNFLGKHFGNEEPARKTGISLGSMKGK
jgi:hypothetical protein